jgi:hypothetical protein
LIRAGVVEVPVPEEVVSVFVSVVVVVSTSPKARVTTGV